MDGLRDPARYRSDAERFPAMADAHTDDPQLRDSYLALAIQFERLADILDKSAASERSRPGVYSQHDREARSQG